MIKFVAYESEIYLLETKATKNNWGVLVGETVGVKALFSPHIYLVNKLVH